MDLFDLFQTHRLRIASGGLFALGLSLSRLGVDDQTGIYLGAALLGLAIPIPLVLLWGERTQPKPNLFWVVVGGLIVASVGSTFSADVEPILFRIVPLGILVGFFLAHDRPFTPSLILGAVLFSAVVHPELDWSQDAEGRAWGIAFASLAGLASAMVERERLQAFRRATTVLSWTVLRLAFVSVWTLVVLTFKEQLRTGALFASLGADPRDEAGRWFLLALVLVCLVLAAFIFRGRKAGDAEMGTAPRHSP